MNIHPRHDMFASRQELVRGGFSKGRAAPSLRHSWLNPRSAIVSGPVRREMTSRCIHSFIHAPSYNRDRGQVVMKPEKVTLAGGERKLIGTRVGDQPLDEIIEVSVILKPKARLVLPHEGGPVISRREFAEKYGADSAAIEGVRQFAKENDLEVTEEWPERRTVKLKGSAANMMRAFAVKLDRYEHQGYRYRARIGDIKLPAELSPFVEAVLGLDNRPQARAHFRVRGEGTTASASGAISYSPRQVAELYQFPLSATGSGETVGILELGGGYKPADLKNYFASFENCGACGHLGLRRRWH